MNNYAREKYGQVMLWASTKTQLQRYIEFHKDKWQDGKRWSHNDAIRHLLTQFDWTPPHMTPYLTGKDLY